MDTDRRMTVPHRAPSRRPVKLATLLVMIAGSILVTAGPAAASVSVAAASDFPNAVTVGQTGVPASITVTNTSTPPNAVGNVTLGTITLVPSCGTFAFTCDPAFADPGVFSLSPTATGEAGTGCAGTTFTITVIDPALGRCS